MSSLPFPIKFNPLHTTCLTGFSLVLAVFTQCVLLAWLTHAMKQIWISPTTSLPLLHLGHRLLRCPDHLSHKWRLFLLKPSKRETLVMGKAWSCFLMCWVPCQPVKLWLMAKVGAHQHLTRDARCWMKTNLCFLSLFIYLSDFRWTQRWGIQEAADQHTLLEQVRIMEMCGFCVFWCLFYY